MQKNSVHSKNRSLSLSTNIFIPFSFYYIKLYKCQNVKRWGKTLLTLQLVLFMKKFSDTSSRHFKPCVSYFAYLQENQSISITFVLSKLSSSRAKAFIIIEGSIHNYQHSIGHMNRDLKERFSDKKQTKECSSLRPVWSVFVSCFT